MGDRGNIFVVDENASTEEKLSGTYFYTHWSGWELPATLASALKRGESRWGDQAYLARIIFCEMVKGEEDDVTGYGISASLGDNSYPILVVHQSWVNVVEEGTETNPKATPTATFTFAEFVEAGAEEGFWTKIKGEDKEDKDE